MPLAVCPVCKHRAVCWAIIREARLERSCTPVTRREQLPQKRIQPSVRHRPLILDTINLEGRCCFAKGRPTHEETTTADRLATFSDVVFAVILTTKLVAVKNSPGRNLQEFWILCT